ncbi:MAG: carboxypeptidase-like regulatory domain-containing protein [Pyrinomonadaceae bacterium]
MNYKMLLGNCFTVWRGAFLLVILSVNAVFAQSGVSSITGTVRDAQGNIIANATVRLVNAEKGFSRSFVTTDSGAYNFASIQPDVYVLEVEASGFKKFVQNNVGALIDKSTEIDVALEAGNISETVTVTSDTIESVINTQDASLGNNFQPEQIQQLPTDLRNVTRLLSLQPGVTRDGSVNGGRSDQSNITLDGIDVNEQQTNQAFSPILRVTAESISEFRVTTSNPNANQGRSSGAQISLSTKSGSNSFNGAAFEFFRPTKGSANDFFNNLAGIERQKLDRHVFGGALGGPIVKNKAFFFYSYEGQREKSETSVLQVVPLPSLGRGELNFISTNGTRVTLNQAQLNAAYTQLDLNPAAIAYLADAARRYPSNTTEGGDGLNTGGFRFNAPVPEDLNTHIVRFDFNLNSNQTLFARANKQHDTRLRAPAFPDTPAPEVWNHNTGVAVGHNWIIGSNKVNSFRYGLTRQAFTAGGDANENSINFRFVFQPFNYTYGFSRVTPVHNFTDDFTWTINEHTLQFGGNIRIIRNKRSDLSDAFDTAIVNPSFYSQSGRSLLTPLNTAANPIQTSNLNYQAAAAALVGRYSQYSANYNFDVEGNVLPAGTPINRNFATEEYDLYVQDSWKLRQNLTLNYGVRYALSRPVYEKDGYQIRPNIPLGDYFEARRASAANGVPYNELINFETAGPSYDKPGFYDMDKNNFQPRVSVAWSPKFKKGFLGAFFGKDNESVFRGGFAMTNDYFGQQLAVTFNNLSSLGFKVEQAVSANTHNVTSNQGPLFTGPGQTVRNFSRIATPPANRFSTPADQAERIESSLDSTLISPTHYNWSLTYGRKLPKGLYVEASYVGRKARNLLVTRDIMAFNNLVDPKSGMDWYTAAGQIYDLYYGGATVNQVTPIPYFENLFPGLATLSMSATQAVFNLNARSAFGDWTYLQTLLDDEGSTPNLFVQPQYAAFSAFSTVGRSDYHGGNLSVRQRLGNSFTFDLNYTFAKSMDDASGLQTAGTYGSAFVLNSLRQQDNYALSDFDVRHNVNANAIWQMPFGRNRRYLNGINKYADAILGGWQLGGIYRWNTGNPFSNLIDLSGWATNWNIRSNVVRTRPIQTKIDRNTRTAFGNLTPNTTEAAKALIASIRPARPGETGDRNVFFGSSYSALDMNLVKNFTMPWNENHKLEFRWEVFNVFNKQYFDEGSFSAQSITPGLPASTSEFTEGTAQFTAIQGAPRRMQFGLRYSF